MIEVVRKDGSKRIVEIMLDRNTNKYCFVNLTSKHVCKCRFNTYEEAIEDLNKDNFVQSWSIYNGADNQISKVILLLNLYNK